MTSIVISEVAIEENKLGMTVAPSKVILTKDTDNLIGISIGGGAPLCPCLYIVQVFDGSPTFRDGSLASGDEIVSINGIGVKGKTKIEAAKMIQSSQTNVTIHYNKLQADIEHGKSFDIVMKKLKHRFVDSMSSNTADALGLSRAILCNDSLVKRLKELEATELMYKGLVQHARRMITNYYDMTESCKNVGDCFAIIGVREPQQRASEAFRTFGEFHRNVEKDTLKMVARIKPVLEDLGTYLNKAVPDTKITVNRYADAKFTYLSYCLKVKEMDDEESGFAAYEDPLYRVESGNYEYRLILKCRQEARLRFAQLRTDVLEKIELLECKHTIDLNKQLRKTLDSLRDLSKLIMERLLLLPALFPVEVDFKETDFQYKPFMHKTHLNTVNTDMIVESLLDIKHEQAMLKKDIHTELITEKKVVEKAEEFLEFDSLKKSEICATRPYSYNLTDKKMLTAEMELDLDLMAANSHKMDLLLK